MLTEKEQKILDEAPEWASHYLFSNQFGGGYAVVRNGVYYDNTEWELVVDYPLDVLCTIESLQVKAKPSLVNTTYKNTVCKGSFTLGNGCGVCDKCIAERDNYTFTYSVGGYGDGRVFPDERVFPNYRHAVLSKDPVNITTKPPLGLRPRSIWLEERKKEITEALQRQLTAGEDLNSEWVIDLKEVNDMINGDIE